MTPPWNAPPANRLLSCKDVHIWQANLDLPGNVRELKHNLSLDERLKAENFRFERDRSRFIVARGILRQMLAGYLNIVPSEIRFCYNINGKPGLSGVLGNTSIQFNLSHSNGLALYVFTRGRAAGIDVEHIRQLPEMEQIVEQFFSARERIVFDALPEREKQVIFFYWWTRKEAFVKAVGDGLSHPLDMFDVRQDEGKSFDAISILSGEQENSSWSMWNMMPADTFAGSVVVEGTGWDVQYWQWPDESDVFPVQPAAEARSFSVGASR